MVYSSMGVSRVSLMPGDPIPPWKRRNKTQANSTRQLTFAVFSYFDDISDGYASIRLILMFLASYCGPRGLEVHLAIV